MITILVTGYLMISLGFFGLFVVLSAIGMAVSLSGPSAGDIAKCAAFSLAWPFLLPWGFVNWIIHKIRK